MGGGEVAQPIEGGGAVGVPGMLPGRGLSTCGSVPVDAMRIGTGGGGANDTDKDRPRGKKPSCGTGGVNACGD